MRVPYGGCIFQVGTDECNIQALKGCVVSMLVESSVNQSKYFPSFTADTFNVVGP